MTVTASLILDLVLLVLLACCVISGFRRGLILTLCSLLAVVLALAGGWYLATHWSQPLQEKLEPVLLASFLSSEQEEAAPETPAPGQTPEDPAASDQETQPSGLMDRFSQAIQEELAQGAETAQTAALTALAASAAALLAKSILFLVGFLVVLAVWWILCHALNLVAKLPGLHFLNKALGGLLGLVKGILLLTVARWALCDLLGWIPAQVAAESQVLSLLETLSLFSWLGA